MGIVSEHYPVCDRCEVRSVELKAPTIREASQKAKQAGWSKYGGLFCPTCRELRVQESINPDIMQNCKENLYVIHKAVYVGNKASAKCGETRSPALTYVWSRVTCSVCHARRRSEGVTPR